jgi:hypothetical protein
MTDSAASANSPDRGDGADEPMILLTALLDSTDVFARSIAVSQAAQLAAIRETIVTTRRNPGLYVRDESRPRIEAVRLATRAVVLELSLRLSVPEATIWSQFHEAEMLIDHLPKLWAAFSTGDVGYRNAREATSVAGSVPQDDPRVFDQLDEALADKAARLTPSQFRRAARAARERIHPHDPVGRHSEALRQRHTEIEFADDGMAWWSLFTDAATVMKIDARMNRGAVRQHAVDGETRTLAQLRADAAGDVLTGRGTAYEVKARVHLNVPATILLDNPQLLTAAHDDRSVLEGYGPIDDATARQLVADSPSFRRVFTDPIRGVDLNMDRTVYRPTAAQREYLRRQHSECDCPTCSIRIDDSDIDHTTDWNFGGLTNIDELAPLSRGHHTLKHKTKIKVTRSPNGRSVWRMPTGYERESDPPPF